MIPFDNYNVVCLAGGVGGAKLAAGLAAVLAPPQLTIIGNNGDDFTHCGLQICPDLDTVMYTLAGAANNETGWGRADESWRVMESVKTMGGPVWFNLGDLDLGTHLTRTYMLQEGQTLTSVTAHLCAQLGVKPRLLPMSNKPAPTLIETAAGVMSFQEWFVQQRWQPAVQRILLPDEARATGQAIQALEKADIVVIAPSNPFVSIDPILNAYPLKQVLADMPRTVVAVTPIIGGQAVKGPAAQLMAQFGLEVSSAGVARYYNEFIDGFVCEAEDAAAVQEDELPVLGTQTLMQTAADRERLAREVLTFAVELLNE